MIEPGSSAWNRCRKGRDEEEALVVMSPYLDAVYDHLNDIYFDGEIVDFSVNPLYPDSPTVAKFRSNLRMRRWGVLQFVPRRGHCPGLF